MNLLQMDMNLLKVLYVLLETSSTGKTAQKLALSPSAVSHALMRLRDALNDPLFRREGNRQIATPYAQALRDKLAPVFVSLNEELFGDKENGSRCFRVVLPPALNALPYARSRRERSSSSGGDRMPSFCPPTLA
ncbi:LysR family transcriptional regulator [Salmonella enterica subsp. enterica]|nr:LysR family transcriptional regulator [Salmonella enterica subsp. enterica]